MDYESSDVFRLYLKVFITRLFLVLEFTCLQIIPKSVYNSLILGPRVYNVEPTYRKSWARNFMMCSNLTLGPSFKVKQR